MKIRHLALAAALGLASSCALAAPIVYTADFTSSGSVSGNVGGFSWWLDDGAGADYLRFYAEAGAHVTLRVDRLIGNLDPALSVYRGATGADSSLFNSVGDWGGMRYLFSLDDENRPFVGRSRSGDPFGSFDVTDAGYYTVAIGGYNSTDVGQYAYRFTIEGATAPALEPVPAPATAWLALLGLGAAGWSRRRGAGERAEVAGDVPSELALRLRFMQA